MTREEQGLAAFLLAEALDTFQGGGAGMRELTAARDALGPLAIVAVGMAERLVATGNDEAAVQLCELSLQGDLFGLRKRGRLLLNLAHVKIRIGDRRGARDALNQAAKDGEVAVLAIRRLAELSAEEGDRDRTRRDSARPSLTGQSAGRPRLARGVLILDRQSKC